MLPGHRVLTQNFIQVAPAWVNALTTQGTVHSEVMHSCSKAVLRLKHSSVDGPM